MKENLVNSHLLCVCLSEGVPEKEHLALRIVDVLDCQLTILVEMVQYSILRYFCCDHIDVI